MKIFMVLACCITLQHVCYAQIITVKDRETGQALELATLLSETPKAFAMTNAQGRADLSAFRGSEKIEIRLLGYQTETTSYATLEKAGFTVSLAHSGLSLDQVVVSATRWNQSKREIPAKITSISARDVALQNPQTAADLLGGSGEVFIQKSQQGGGSPMIRGFSTNRVLLTVDGIRMNTAIFRSGNLQNAISLDPFSIENTEVFFGPGSVIYGSDAIGGVMNFQTLTPQFTLTDKPLVSGKAAARTASANREQTGHFDFNAGWEKWAFVTSFSHNDFGDLRMGANGPDEYLRPLYVQRQNDTDVVIANDEPLVQRPTAYSQINMMQKLRFKPNEKWDFNYGFHYSTTTDYSRYDRHVRYRNGLPRSAEWYYGPQKWMMNNLNIAHTGSTGLFDQMTLRLAYQFFEESRVDRDFNDPERRRRLEKVKAYSANLDFLKGVGDRQKLFYGLEWVYNDVNSSGTDEDISTGNVIPGPARYPQAGWASYAAYLTWQYKISDKFLVQAGARYNRFALNATFDTTFFPFPYTKADLNKGALTGSMGFVYDPTASWSLSANVSTGFRSPNVDDVGKVFDSEPGAVMVPNPNLNAEYAYNAEFDIAKVFGKSVKIDVTGFYTVLKNALVRRNFTLNGQDSILYDGELSQVLAIQNAARATIYGLQANIEIKFPGGFGITSRFNYQQGEEELDDGSTSPLRHAAPWFGVTSMTYNAYPFTMSFYTMYNGEVSYKNLPQEERGKDYIYAIDADGNPYSPAWYTLNFKAMYQFTDHLSLSGGVENLADKRYRPYSSGIVAPGRNFILSLRANF
jgi:hemoglobin/transferrin/lactoferrin receptor protein